MRHFNWEAVCRVLAHPSSSLNPQVLTRLGFLPSEPEVHEKPLTVIVGAVLGEHIDIFQFCAKHLQDPQKFWRDQDATWKLNLMKALASSDWSPWDFLACIPVQSFVTSFRAHDSLRHIAHNTPVFTAFCQAFADAGVDLHELALTLDPHLREHPSFRVAVQYYDPNQVSKRVETLRNVLETSLNAATTLYERCLQQRVGLFEDDLVGAAEVLVDCCSNSNRLDRLMFLLQMCPSIGFDVTKVIRLLTQTGELFHAELSPLRYLFSDHLGLPKTMELLRPKDLLIFFRTQEAMQYAFQELGYPVPDPASVELEELLVRALSDRGSFATARYIFQKCEPELSAEAQTRCLDLICTGSKSVPEKVVGDLLQYFIRRSWLRSEISDSLMAVNRNIE